MRVYEIAKELGLHSKDVLALLEKHGISLPSHMSVLTDKALELLKKPIPSQKQAPSLIKKIAEKSEEVKTVSEQLRPVKKNENHNIPTSGVAAPIKELKEAVVLHTNEQLNSTKGAVRLQSTVENRSATGIKGYRVEDDEQLRYQLENEEVTEEAPLKNEKISLLLQRKGLIIERRPTRKRGRRRRGRVQSVAPESPVVTQITLEKSLPLYEAAALLGKTAGDVISVLLKRGMV